jgi:hypothetical protein
MQAGMIDRIDSFQSIVSKLVSGRVKIGSMAAADNWDAPTDAERFRMRVRERQASLSAMIGEN